jgi:hypothetical protein
MQHPVRQSLVRPSGLVAGNDRNRALIPNRRVCSAIQHIYLRIPEVSIGLVILRALLLLALNLSQSFLLLISPARGLVCRFATNQKPAG